MLDAARRQMIQTYIRFSSANSLRQRLMHGVLWVLIGSVSFRGLELAATVVLGRLLGKEVFGELGIIISTVGLMSTFAAAGLGITGTKYVAEFWRNDPERAGRIIGTSITVSLLSGLIVVIILFFLSPWLAAYMLNAPHLSVQIQISCGYLFFEALNGVLIGILAGFESFKVIAKLKFYRGIINFPAVIVFVWSFGLSGAIGAMVMVSMVAWWINWLAVRKLTRELNIRIDYLGVKAEKQILWKFSLPAVLAGAMVGPVTWGANTILVNQVNGYTEMGIFSAANQWGMAILFLPRILSQAIMPMLSSFYGMNDRKSTAKLLWLSVAASGIIVLPIIFLMIVFNKSIMNLYGQEFIEGASVLIIVALTVGFTALGTPVWKMIAASDKMWVGVFTNFCWAVVLLACAWFFIGQGMGAYGLAMAYLIAYAFQSLWTFGFALNILRKENDRVPNL